MSGGVDSAVAAALLKEQGFDVIGLYMSNWKETDGSGCCTGEEDWSDVRRVCDKIGIPYYSADFSRQYMDNVFRLFVEEYKKGRTPNPDVLCNREVKFGPFADFAREMGADCIATGHYCRVRHDGDIHYLLRARDDNKDQTYFLNQVTQPQLANVLFPLAGLPKEEVRAIAEKHGLATAKKKDSTGICFIGERNFRKFLSEYLPAKPGKILALNGEEVGEHVGLMHYTIGQRRGVNIGGKSGESGRWFVVKKDVANNVLYVSHGDESPLYSKECEVSGLNFIGIDPPLSPIECTAKFRYRQGEQKVTVIPEGDKVRVVFAEKQRAVTEGQYAVFYDETRCLGGGVIDKVIY